MQKESEGIKDLHSREIDRQRKKLIKYDADDFKEKRLEKQICKYCFYIRADDIVMDAFTSSKCEECNKDLMFCNSNTDKYCLDCARKLRVCKHCGADID